MTATPRTITFDCADPAAQVRFWSGVTGRPVDTLPEGTPAQFVGAIGMWPRSNDLAYLFLAVPEGKTAKNRMHLDLECADRSAEVERLVALGATHVSDHSEFGITWTVLRDPEGNEFCLAEHH
ncbi:catechol 2,3-dioxygenase-like lactoylglutathione lyase family enzyme [Kineosphaera limosa]|uniref:Glyoxalase-like domain-containing protein n=1 Tax=Kineosphaera limosa NBRC 100340 TaxID=1184609 RepID=K6VJL0_9MICO|nr:VOC family protein [Kineosphaera limosa]NYE00791.1 catechol 2,3-dioxygenase-like lactoylglutathione lyase family enzyme [Kineosphaera limosa]GAB96403.1 hypothetical protein KILIM_037_00220 [Kineosphaera limosa NBRC 100340]